ncbi:hypothetical protein M9435_004033 [Picochlorum sp. BPE23]|nr:hypothetical protein M9435_004033 [Picochlorum sp. BPE23]
MGICGSKPKVSATENKVDLNTPHEPDAEEDATNAPVSTSSDYETHRLSSKHSLKHLVRHHRESLFHLPYKPGLGESGRLRKEEALLGIGKNYSLIRAIGKGGTSTVWLAHDNEFDEEVAIKLYSRPLPESDMLMVYNEVVIGSTSARVGSTHLCAARSVFLTESHLGIVMEAAQGGNLAEYVSDSVSYLNRKGRGGLALDEDTARFVFKQLIASVAYMHSTMHVAHRDLKLDNTLIMSSEKLPGRVKLADFQFAYHFGENSHYAKYQGLLGTPVYMAPELLELRFASDTSLPHRYDPVMSDVWACGILLVALLVGGFPFDDVASAHRIPHKTMLKVEEAIYELQKKHSWKDSGYVKPYLKLLSKECVELIDGILDLDVRKRWSLAKIARHPWMTNPFNSIEYQEEWERIEKQDKEDVRYGDGDREWFHIRYKAVKKLLTLATRHHHETEPVADENTNDDQVPPTKERPFVEFESPEFSGFVSHHNFDDNKGIEISLHTPVEQVLRTQSHDEGTQTEDINVMQGDAATHHHHHNDDGDGDGKESY